MAERVNQHKNPIIGQNIKRLRKLKNLKAIELVAMLQLDNVSISSGTLSKVENGRNNPSVDLIMSLKKIFDVDYEEFFKI